MKAVRVLQYGPPSVIEIDDVPRPSPGRGHLLVRVEAAGVGNWDALFREGKSKLEPLPIILGSDISGTVEALGPGGFRIQARRRSLRLNQPAIQRRPLNMRCR